MRRSSAPSKKRGELLCSVKDDVEPRKGLKVPCSSSSVGHLRSTESILNLLSSASKNSCGSKNDKDHHETDSLEKVENENKEIDINNFEDQAEQNLGQEIVKNNESSAENDKNRIFNVVYGKISKKKHKTWEGDGILEVAGISVTLKDSDGTFIGRASNKKYADIHEGTQFYLANKEVEVLEEIKKTIIAERKRPLESNDNLPCKHEIKKCKSTNIIGEKVKRTVNFNSVLFAKTAEIKPLIMPRPDQEHQWIFNTSNAQLRDVVVDNRLASKLRRHQKDGIIFLYRCVVGLRNHKYVGAILADEMGLGKTLQSITLIWTLMKQGPYGNPLIKRVLIVTPSSLVGNWNQEFMHWLGRERIKVFTVDQKNKPSDYAKLHNIPALIISYEMFVRYYEDVSNIKFDLIICDEGHRLKNNNIRTSMLLNQIHCRRRVLLTGTPIQNDLQEFHALVDFVNPGILGTYTEFRKTYEEPIVMSRQPRADEYIRKKGENMAQKLNHKTSGFILRRTQALINQFLPSKHEAVVFCIPTDLQKLLYKTAAEVWESRLDKTEFESSEISHLSVIMTMKKISNHPLLVDCKLNQEPDDLTQCLSDILANSSKGLIEESSKLELVMCLLKNLQQTKEKLVLVSYYTQTLDMLAELCSQNEFRYCRLDGATPSAQRVSIVNKFNSTHSQETIFLLSGKAGGTGLNLTGASRLVLFDSDWNPASDLQAMARIWRDGQTKSVYIYRLLNAGTIEEKIFQRQLSKASLCETVVDTVSLNSTVRLSKDELKDLFTIHDRACLTHDLMECSCTGYGEVMDNSDITNDNIQNDIQLNIETESFVDCKPTLRMNELFRWEHHACPISSALIKEMALDGAENNISFIFHNTTTKKL
ncbi:DNA repair and recombination protein RAD54B-like [Lycorma delicatula]|uniref:DNA repair and recombination protein RAD54B-like n=1 Tax=Lycorma delicatula TaxID=130591 RepID=UPI003F51788F